MINVHFVIVGFILGVGADVLYSIHTIQGKIQPNRVSWLLWGIAPIIAFAAEINKGVGLRSLLTFGVGFGPLLVVAASFWSKKSVWKLTMFDYGCGALSILALVLWAITKQGNLAIALSIAADGFAGLPTIVKSYKKPESESWFVFFVGALNGIITLLTIKYWNFATYGFPLYILIICVIITSLTAFKIGPRLKVLSTQRARQT